MIGAAFATGSTILYACGSKDLSPTHEAPQGLPSIDELSPFLAFPGEKVTVTGKEFLDKNSDPNKMGVFLAHEDGGVFTLVSYSAGKPANSWGETSIEFFLSPDMPSQIGKAFVINGEGKVSNPFPLEIINPNSNEKITQLFLKTMVLPSGKPSAVIKSINLPKLDSDTKILTTISDESGTYFVSLNSGDRTSVVIDGPTMSLNGQRQILNLTKGKLYKTALYPAKYLDSSSDISIVAPAILQGSFEIK